jgi:thymidylate synthase (FAD)
MNARELHHFFSLRACRRAQWEIREMAKRMLSAARVRAPLLFETAGPGCVRGRCPEGKMSCGKPGEVRREIAALGKGVGD